MNVDTMAVVWLVLLVLCVLSYVIFLFRYSDYGFWESLLYTPTYLFGRLLWRVELTNSPPKELSHSGAILVSNHRSSVDPFFIQLGAKRRVHWMVAREYCENGATAPILRLCQVIPTNRSGMDNASMKTAIRLARSGRLIGMFPEGQLNHTPLPLLPVRSGAALVALRASVPIIPIWLSGSPYRREVWSPLTMAAHVKITFGNPIHAHAENLCESSCELNSQEIAQAGLSKGTNEDTTFGTASGNVGTDRKADLVRAEQLILEWARRVLVLAGHATFHARVAGRSRLEQKQPCKIET